MSGTCISRISQRSLASRVLSFSSSFSLFIHLNPRRAMHWIGIDMSKATFHAALNDSSVEVFANTPEGIEQFVGALRTDECIPEDTTIGVEATGVYHLLLSRILTDKGWKVMVINPMLSHRVITASLR